MANAKNCRWDNCAWYTEIKNYDIHIVYHTSNKITYISHYNDILSDDIESFLFCYSLEIIWVDENDKKRKRNQYSFELKLLNWILTFRNYKSMLWLKQNYKTFYCRNREHILSIYVLDESKSFQCFSTNLYSNISYRISNNCLNQ